MILIAPPAIDVDATQRAQRFRVAPDQMDGVVPKPVLPARGNRLARLEVKGQAKTQRRRRIRVVGRGHADVHDRVSFRRREFFLAPHGFQEPLDASVILSRGKPAPRRGLGKRVVCTGAALGIAKLRELVQRVRPVVAVDEIEIRIARVISDGAPVLRVFHPVNDRPVTAGRLAEASAMLPRSKRTEFAVDERNDLARQVIRVVADRRRIDVLVSAKARETIREHDDRGAHLALANQSRRALRHVVAERLPADVSDTGSREPHEVVKDGKARAAAPACALVVLRGKPDSEPPDVRVAQRIVGEYFRRVLAHDDLAGGRLPPFSGHSANR